MFALQYILIKTVKKVCLSVKKRGTVLTKGGAKMSFIVQGGSCAPLAPLNPPLLPPLNIWGKMFSNLPKTWHLIKAASHGFKAKQTMTFSSSVLSLTLKSSIYTYIKL